MPTAACQARELAAISICNDKFHLKELVPAPALLIVRAMCRFPRPTLLACLAAPLLMSLSALADPPPLRQTNPALNVPASPPATSLSLENAFPGVSFDAPTCIASPPAPSNQLFVCEKAGKIWIIPDVTAATPSKSLFLDLAALVNSRNTGDPANLERFRTVNECGLLGLAFHPNYATNRQFYVLYTPGVGSTASNAPLHERLARFFRHATNPNLAITGAGSETTLLQIRDNNDNHEGGDIHFGPDGYLYVSFGDEGNQADANYNAQLIDRDFYSGILRIDVDKKPGNLEPNPHPNPNHPIESTGAIAIPRDGGIARYSIPADNPFVGAETFNGEDIDAGYVRSEFWAVGFRNPWRFSFDGNNLWCGDVGGSAREEVNLVTKGGNYGWIYKEGTGSGPWDDSDPPHPVAPAGFSSIAPFYNYPHGSGLLEGDCIVGGVVSRGGRVSSLYGKYIFGDYEDGHIWSMNLDDRVVTRIGSQGSLSAFGTDPSNGDVLVADYAGDRLMRIVSSTTTGTSFPDTLTETGLFSSVANLTPAPGLIPYSVNLPFWSDHAIKRRWFTVPNANASITWSKDGLWTLPTGSIWVKHFDMEMQRGVPSTKKRIETRLLVKNASGAYGVSYKWNDAGTEATLVEDEGENFPLTITENGNTIQQTWSIPARGQCMICHTQQAGYALSFNTRQLNLASDMSGHTGNQLTTLFNQGYLSNSPGSPNLLPRHLRPDESTYSVEARVRSYLAVNCSYCHKEDGTTLAEWDGRPELLLEDTGLINGNVTNNNGNSANKLVVPGDTLHSAVLNRVAVTNGFTRMPPLGSNVIDSAAATLLTTWINGELSNRTSYDAWRALNFEPDNDPAGEATADADGDGRSNRDEFLAGTDPHNGSSTFQPRAILSPPSLRFTLPANRSFKIETSPDLGSWTPWDIPQNQGLPVAGGLIDIAFPAADPQRFFRVELLEN